MDERKVLRSNVVLEIEGTGNKYEFPEEFWKSYYYEQYLQAFKVTEEIIKQTIKIKDGEKEINPYRNQEICNIIPFIGKRGTGKTSAMLSFAGALSLYHDNYLTYKDKLIYKLLENDNKWKNNLNFICLGHIDGSLLERGEDIFKVVLAQMYRKFLEFDRTGDIKTETYGYEKRKLQQEFDKIYRSIVRLDGSNKNVTDWEESSIVSLMGLSNSLELKNDFCNLVEHYLEMFQHERSGRKEKCQNFLTIVIDDLDLNIENGFDIMEKIHRYMMVPQVIVLIAIDYNQLRRLGEKRFFKMIPKVHSIMVGRQAEADELSRDFMDKVLPNNARIFVPNFNKMETVKVRVNHTEFTVKQAVFLELYNKLGIRFDTKGLKRHFYIPDTIRKFANIYLLLENLESLELKGYPTGEDKTLFTSEYDTNYRIILNDMFNRMAQENLTVLDYKFFVSLTENTIARSCRKVADKIKKLVLTKKEPEAGLLQDLSNDIMDYGYSYGELMRIIYCWGRVNEEDKEIIRCLLAYYSIEFTRIFYRYCLSGRKKDSEEYNTFSEIFNGSFAGSWANKMVPQILNGDRRLMAGAVRDVVLKDISFKIESGLLTKEERLKAMNAFLCKETEEASEEEKQERKKYKDELGRIFRSVIVLSMFFSQATFKKSPTFEWLVQERDNAKKDFSSEVVRKLEGDEFGASASLEIQMKSGKADFNFFNFVNNSFRYEEIIDSIQNSLFDTLFRTTVPDKESPEQKAEREKQENMKRDSVLEKIGIKEEFTKWEQYSGGFAVPIYDLDVCYNLMKRVRKQMFSEMKKDYSAADTIEYFFGLLKNHIEEPLKKNDDYYQNIGVELTAFSSENSNHCLNVNYADAYRFNPIVRWMYAKDKLLVKNFNNVFADVLSDVVGCGEAKQGETISNGMEMEE